MVIVTVQNKNTGEKVSYTLQEWRKIRVSKLFRRVFREVDRVKEPPEITALRERQAQKK